MIRQIKGKDINNIKKTIIKDLLPECEHAKCKKLPKMSSKVCEDIINKCKDPEKKKNIFHIACPTLSSELLRQVSQCALILKRKNPKKGMNVVRLCPRNDIVKLRDFELDCGKEYSEMEELVKNIILCKGKNGKLGISFEDDSKVFRQLSQIAPQIFFEESGEKVIVSDSLYGDLFQSVRELQVQNEKFDQQVKSAGPNEELRREERVDGLYLNKVKQLLIVLAILSENNLSAYVLEEKKRIKSEKLAQRQCESLLQRAEIQIGRTVSKQWEDQIEYESDSDSNESSLLTDEEDLYYYGQYMLESPEQGRHMNIDLLNPNTKNDQIIHSLFSYDMDQYQMNLLTMMMQAQQNQVNQFPPPRRRMSVDVQDTRSQQNFANSLNFPQMFTHNYDLHYSLQQQLQHQQLYQSYQSQYNNHMFMSSQMFPIISKPDIIDPKYPHQSSQQQNRQQQQQQQQQQHMSGQNQFEQPYQMMYGQQHMPLEMQYQPHLQQHNNQHLFINAPHPHIFDMLHNQQTQDSLQYHLFNQPNNYSNQFFPQYLEPSALGVNMNKQIQNNNPIINKNNNNINNNNTNNSNNSINNNNNNSNNYINNNMQKMHISQNITPVNSSLKSVSVKSTNIMNNSPNQQSPQSTKSGNKCPSSGSSNVKKQHRLKQGLSGGQKLSTSSSQSSTSSLASQSSTTQANKQLLNPPHKLSFSSHVHQQTSPPLAVIPTQNNNSASFFNNIIPSPESINILNSNTSSNFNISTASQQNSNFMNLPPPLPNKKTSVTQQIHIQQQQNGPQNINHINQQMNQSMNPQIGSQNSSHLNSQSIPQNQNHQQVQHNSNLMTQQLNSLNSIQINQLINSQNQNQMNNPQNLNHMNKQINRMNQPINSQSLNHMNNQQQITSLNTNQMNNQSLIHMNQQINSVNMNSQNINQNQIHMNSQNNSQNYHINHINSQINHPSMQINSLNNLNNNSHNPPHIQNNSHFQNNSNSVGSSAHNFNNSSNIQQQPKSYKMPPMQMVGSASQLHPHPNQKNKNNMNLNSNVNHNKDMNNMISQPIQKVQVGKQYSHQGTSSPLSALSLDEQMLPTSNNSMPPTSSGSAYINNNYQGSNNNNGNNLPNFYPYGLNGNIPIFHHSSAGQVRTQPNSSKQLQSTYGGNSSINNHQGSQSTQTGRSQANSLGGLSCNSQTNINNQNANQSSFPQIGQNCSSSNNVSQTIRQNYTNMLPNPSGVSSGQTGTMGVNKQQNIQQPIINCNNNMNNGSNMNFNCNQNKKQGDSNYNLMNNPQQQYGNKNNKKKLCHSTSSQNIGKNISNQINNSAHNNIPPQIQACSSVTVSTTTPIAVTPTTATNTNNNLPLIQNLLNPNTQNQSQANNNNNINSSTNNNNNTQNYQSNINSNNQRNLKESKRNNNFIRKQGQHLNSNNNYHTPSNI